MSVKQQYGELVVTQHLTLLAVTIGGTAAGNPQSYRKSNVKQQRSPTVQQAQKADAPPRLVLATPTLACGRVATPLKGFQQMEQMPPWKRPHQEQRGLAVLHSV